MYFLFSFFFNFCFYVAFLLFCLLSPFSFSLSFFLNHFCWFVLFLCFILLLALCFDFVFWFCVFVSFLPNWWISFLGSFVCLVVLLLFDLYGFVFASLVCVCFLVSVFLILLFTICLGFC